QVLLAAVEITSLMRGGFVAELSVVAGDSKLFNQSKRREQLWLFEQDLRKNFLVEEIETPRAEPDEIDKEDRRHDEQEGDDPENPLQRFSDHVEVLPAYCTAGQFKLRTRVNRSRPMRSVFSYCLTGAARTGARAFL